MKTYIMDQKGRVAVPPEAIDMLTSPARQAAFGAGLAIFKTDYGFDLVPEDELARRANSLHLINSNNRRMPAHRLERAFYAGLCSATKLDCQNRVALPQSIREAGSAFEATVEESYVRYSKQVN